MFNSDGISGLRSLSSIEAHERRTRSTSGTVSVASAAVLVCAGLLASAVWSVISPTPIAVFSALVQTGIPTRLVLLGLLFGCGVGLFAFRTRTCSAGLPLRFHLRTYWGSSRPVIFSCADWSTFRKDTNGRTRRVFRFESSLSFMF